MTAARLIRFGIFEVDLKTGELRKQGGRIRLQEKPFQILAILLERAGDVVTREELRERLWPEDTFVDFDNSLNTAMSKLREALGESAGSPRYVETLPRRGYRFIGTISSVEPGSETVRNGVLTGPEAITNGQMIPLNTGGELSETIAEPEAAAPAEATQEPRTVTVAAEPAPELSAAVSPPAPRRTLRWVAFVTALLLVGGAAYLWLRPQPVPGNGKIRLAVLPFKNLSGDTEQDYLSDGLTEEMIAQLGRLQPQRLAVIARTSAMQYRDTRKSVGQIGQELGVDYVLEGSVRRANDRVRITAQLIQVRDQTQVWAENYERDAADIIELQSEVARRIAGALAVELLPSHSRATNPQAYEAYLKGRYHWSKRTESDIRQAIDYFRQAIQKDERYALAWSGLADAYIVLESYSRETGAETIPKAHEAAMKALQLDPTLAEVRTSVAAVHQMEWNWEAAEREFQQAITINPNYATAHQWYSELLTMKGRTPEALAEARHAKELDPLSHVIPYVLAYNLYAARKYDESVAEYRRALELEPTFNPARFGLAMTLEQARRYKESMIEWVKLIGGNPDRREEAAALQEAFEKSGFDAAVRLRYAQLQRRMQRGEYVSRLLMVRVALRLGKKDEAFHWLEEAFKERRQRLLYLAVDPIYDTIRDDPRYKDLVQRLRL